MRDAVYLAEKYHDEIEELIKLGDLANLVEFIGDKAIDAAAAHEAGNHPVVGGFRMPD